MNHRWIKTQEWPEAVGRYAPPKWECERCGASVFLGYHDKPRKTLRVMNPFGGPAVTCEQYAVLSVQES